MITTVTGKIRVLIKDSAKTRTDVFTYSDDFTGSTISLQEDKGISILSVKQNGGDFASGISYSYSSITNEITFTGSLTDGDIITVKYNYYQYSDTELEDYAKGALVYMSVYSDDENDYEIESGGELVPTPDNKTTDLIALVAAILIKPEYSSYSLPTVNVRIPKTMDRDEKIRQTIMMFKYCAVGVLEIVEHD